jgi:hypothetical protein
MKKIIVFLLLATMGQLLPVVVQLPAAEKLKEALKRTSYADLAPHMEKTGIFAKLGGSQQEVFAVALAVEVSLRKVIFDARAEVQRKSIERDKLDRKVKDISIFEDVPKVFMSDLAGLPYEARAASNAAYYGWLHEYTILPKVEKRLKDALDSKAVLKIFLRDSDQALAELEKLGIIADCSVPPMGNIVELLDIVTS